METKSVIGGEFDIDESCWGNRSNPSCLQVKSHYTYSSGRAALYHILKSCQSVFFCRYSISTRLFMFYYH